MSTLALNMFLPSLANIALAFGTDYALVSLSVAGYLAATAVMQLAVGPLSDRLGRRPVLLAALTVFSAASVVCALAEDIWTFLAFRMLQAAMISGYALSLAIVRDITPERETAGRIGYIGMSMAIAPMLGPVLGGMLDAAFGWRANFYFYAGTGLSLLVLAWFDVGETLPPRADQAGRERDTVAALVREPRFWGYALTTAASTGAFYVFLAGAPLVAQSAFGVGTAKLGGYIGSITAGFMAGGFAAGRLAPGYRLTVTMLAGRVIACAGLVAGLAILSLGAGTPLFYFGCTVFVGFGNGITIPSSTAGAMSVRPGLAGSAAGLNGALTVAGGAVLTNLKGVLIGGPYPTYVLLAIMLAASFAGLLATLWVVWLERPDGTAAQSG